MPQSNPKLIVNITRGNVVCEQGIVADRSFTRMRGLLGRSLLPAGEGLLLKPAPSIHTAFMRFPIDVAFLDGNLQVVKLVQQLKPWRTAAARRAKVALELAAGEISRRGLEIADRLAVLEQVTEHPAVDLQTRVLLVASDRRFRTVASALLSRRGYSVVVRERDEEITELAARGGADVVVIDASASLTAAARLAAKLQALTPPVGVVAVSSEPHETLLALPILSKWGSFSPLFVAIERARNGNGNGRVGVTNGRH
jgi:uncharacterized membrane protein (UPF0127 family)